MYAANISICTVYRGIYINICMGKLIMGGIFFNWVTFTIPVLPLHFPERTRTELFLTGAANLASSTLTLNGLLSNLPLPSRLSTIMLPLYIHYMIYGTSQGNPIHIQPQYIIASPTTYIRIVNLVKYPYLIRSLYDHCQAAHADDSLRNQNHKVFQPIVVGHRSSRSRSGRFL